MCCLLKSHPLLRPLVYRAQFVGLQGLREQARKDNFAALKIRMLNDRLMFAERGFLDSDGLQGRQWFKHLVSTSCHLS